MSTDVLDRIHVTKPCEAYWDSMIGNDQVRFCEHCSLTVHDLSQMTRKRARRLVAKSKGRLCIRYQRRPDGSLITRAAPQLIRIGRRASRIAAGAFSASLSLSSAVASPSMERPNIVQGRMTLAQQDASRQVYVSSTIAGTVTDANGAVISGAGVSLTKTSQELGFFTSSNAEGEYRFQGLESGSYNLRIEATGFEPSDETIYIGVHTNQRADRRLQVATIRQEIEIQSTTTTGVMSIAPVQPIHPLVKAAQDDDFLNVLAVLTRENVNVRDKATGETALEHAVRNGNREMLQALISVGANVNSRNTSKGTPLMMLTEEATADMVWDLIHAGAKLELKDEDGDTALIEAAMVNNLSVLQALLQAGAKVDVKNNEGQTALMLAVSNDKIKNVKALIAAGADLNATDKKGQTPLDYAIAEGYDKIVKLLQSYGAIEGKPVEDKD